MSLVYTALGGTVLYMCLRGRFEGFDATPTPEPQYGEDIVYTALSDGTPPPFDTPDGYTAIQDRGFRNDMHLITSLNVPDTRIEYTFAGSLDDAVRLCNEKLGIGFSPLYFTSKLGVAVVLLRDRTVASPPLGWHPVDQVPVTSGRVFYQRT